jgi:hypothetical protein
MPIVEEIDASFDAMFPPKVSWKRAKIMNKENEEIGVKIADKRT